MDAESGKVVNMERRMVSATAKLLVLYRNLPTKSVYIRMIN